MTNAVIRFLPYLATLIYVQISLNKNWLKINFLVNMSCYISDSTKTIRLLALDFYKMIADSGFALITLQKSRARNLIVN